MTQCAQKSPILPSIGFGTNLYPWLDEIEKHSETSEDLKDGIQKATEIGYTWFDVTDDNYKDVIKATQSTKKIQRKDLIYSHRIYTIPSVEWTKERTKEIGYFDMMYVGNPPFTTYRSEFKTVIGNVWIGLLKCKAEGLTKYVGICNFQRKQLQIFLEWCDDNEYQYPDFGIIETHPFYSCNDLIEYYNDKKILPIAYGSLGGVGSDYFQENSDIKDFVSKYKLQSFAQACIGYNSSRGISTIVRSLKKEHLLINAETPVDRSDIQWNELNDVNIYSPFNNDTSNAIVANGGLKI
jgi:diketogulonate reductase-like aldo/keto reductase